MEWRQDWTADEKKQYWRERRQRCYEHLRAEPFKELDKLAATDIETGGPKDGYTLGAPIVGWIVTRKDGKEWLGTTLEEWIACLFCKDNRGYLFLCHTEYEFSYLCAYLVKQSPETRIAPVTRKDGMFLSVKCKRNKHVITIRNTFAVCATTLERYLAAYAPNTPKQPRDWGTEEQPNYWDPRNPQDIAYLQADGRGLLEAYENQRRETYENFGVNLRLTSGATAIAAHRRTLPKDARYWRQHPQIEAYCRDAAHGGLVIAQTTNVRYDMEHIDRNAMYGWSERTYGAPVGTGMRTRTFYTDRPGIYDIEVTVPESETTPFLPARDSSGALVWPVGETFTTRVTDIEVCEALRLGYPLRILEGVVFERIDFLYDSILAKCESLERDAVLRNNDVCRENAKSIRNPLSGKFGSGNTAPRFVCADDCPDGYTPYLDPVTGMSSEFLYWKEEAVNVPHLQPHWYAYTTAGARVAISRLMRDYSAVYCDTDSLVLTKEALQRAVADRAVQLGTAYGEWKVENSYFLFQSGGPKNYQALTTNGVWKDKSKGTPRKQIVREDHTHALNGEEVSVTYRTVTKPLSLLKNYTSGTNVSLSKVVKRRYSTINNSKAWRVEDDGRIRSRKLEKVKT